MSRFSSKRTITLIVTLAMLITLVPAVSSVKASAADSKLVALTFDDGPSTYTPALLDVLDKYEGVKVTFFIQGVNAKRYQDTLKREWESGHQIANHTWDHPTLSTQSDAKVKSEIADCEAYLDMATGGGVDYILRPPYGDFSSRVASLISTPAIIWSVDPEDWKYNEASRDAQFIISHVHDGAIVLCHDVKSSSPACTDIVVRTLLEEGYEFVTVNELFRRRGVAMEAGVKYYSCRPTGTQLGPVSEPVITEEPSAGGKLITITADEGARIYYTLDGTEPGQFSDTYTGPFTVYGEVTVKAVAAFNYNGSRSGVKTEHFSVFRCLEPTITGGGALPDVTGQEGSTVRYTLDGTMPTESSPVWTGSETVSPGTVVTAAAFIEGWLPSEPVEFYYSPSGQVYTDVMPGDWYADTVDQAVISGLFDKTGDFMFSPAGRLERWELIQALYRTVGEPSVTSANPYSDVTDDAPYLNALIWASERGIAMGYGDGRFGPEDGLSRDGLMKILDRFLVSIGRQSAQEADAVIASAGNEDGAIPATRAEAAAMLLRFMDIYGVGRIILSMHRVLAFRYK